MKIHRACITTIYKNKSCNEVPMPLFQILEKRILPEDAEAHWHNFTVNEQRFTLKVSRYKTGEPGEVQITAAQASASVNGLLNGLAKTSSLNLQYGISLESMLEGWKATRFEPSGFTGNRHMPHARSILEYAGVYLEHYQVVFPSPPSARQQTTLSDLASTTHKFSLDGREGYITCTFYQRESIEPARVGKLKIEWAREGSLLNGLMNAISTCASVGLQYGVPLIAYCKEWKGLSFPPNGITAESELASSVLDYAANFLIQRLELEK